jgi:hypothetical protein
MKVKRVAPGWYEVHTGHGVYTVRNCPADNPRATGLPAGPRWMVTYPGEATADAEYPTKRAAVANIATLHDEHERKADVERQNRTRRAAGCTCPRGESNVYAAHHRTVCEQPWQAAQFDAFAVGDRIRFQTIDNGFGGSGDFIMREGVVTAVTARTLRVDCGPGPFGSRAVLTRSNWYRRDPYKAAAR